MFDPGNMKRLSPNTFDQNVRLKKPCVADISKPSNNPPGTHNWDQYKTEIGVEYALQASSLIPQCLVATSNCHGIDNAGSGMTDNQALPISTSPSDSAYLDAETCLVSGDDMESLGGESSLAGEEDAVPEFCFGVIIMTIKSASRISDANGIALVDLQAFGDAVKITLQSSGKYAGLIRSPVIRQLLDDSTVELRTTCTESSPSSTQATGKSARSMLHDSTARIVIFGAKQEKLRIGKILSDASIFLQHPYAEECGDQEYSNPHYLLRPGATMPKLQNAAGFGAVRAAKSGILSEINKSRIIQIFDGSNLGSSQEICPQTYTSPRLKSELKHHQLQAIAVMVEREGGGVESCHFPSTWETTRFSDRAKRYRHTVTGVYSEYATPSMGGLLADDMGLGKTLSTLGLICLSTDSRTRGQDTAHTTLVITTKSTLPGWQFQINQHVHNGQLRTALYHGPHRHSHAEHFDEQDLVLTTYETLRADYEAKGPLYENQWHRVVLDEAHHIRNRSSQIFLASCSIRSTFRWCLTGTPVHNSLDDYGALLSFLGVPSFTEKTMFDLWITKPIQQKKKEGFNRLQTLVRTTCLRRTKESLGDALSLPTRNEEIEFVSLHQQDQELYDFFKSRAAELALGSRAFNPATATLKSSQDGNILSLLNFLRLICNHGQQILPETALKIWNARDRTMSDRHEIMVNGDSDGSHALSAKVLALLKNLISTHTPTLDIQGQYVPVKSVVFSYWTKMLDLIQQALATYSFNTCRIDGSTSLEGRIIALKRFREDPECSVMLATIGSAGEGLDLTVANHVHLIEPHWSPMAEAQAVDRVYRIGQQREVNVMRYIVPNSIETYIQWVQQQKLKIISQIVETQGTTQAEIDTERWKQLRDNLGCKTE